MSQPERRRGKRDKIPSGARGRDHGLGAPSGVRGDRVSLAGVRLSVTGIYHVPNEGRVWEPLPGYGATFSTGLYLLCAQGWRLTSARELIRSFGLSGRAN